MKTAQRVGAAMVPRLPHSSAAIPVMRYGHCTFGTKRAGLRCHRANFRHAVKIFQALEQGHVIVSTFVCPQQLL